MKFQITINDLQYNVERKDDAILVNGERREVSFERISANRYSLLIDNRSHTILVAGEDDHLLKLLGRDVSVEARVKTEKELLLERFGLQSAAEEGDREIRAPMPGLVLRIPVEVGQTVNEGDAIIVIEAMKMENELRATGAGSVGKLHVAPGDAVTKNQLLMEISD